MKSDKMPYIVSADIESLIRKIDQCPNNPENFSTKKIGESTFVDIQCQQFVDLIIQKTRILYIMKKIV